ncbi:hypothetical protein D915_002764 [Fasciola hepatica]|uniref:G-protein coupled receptors family 1 profile domain-containing protein n=1 Tax=Fasciola hepatica TaxID=6192 RepID=A0A4E0RFQ4_FASHE|nr:hypothetical protein D915_002764 [Fasciola hepatica]
MSSESPFSSLHADLIRLLPPDTSGRLDSECFYRYRYGCLELFADHLNRSLFTSNDSENPFTLKHFDNMCQDDKPQAWVTERAYVVALTMAILGCIGLAGNVMSCVVITMHLLKFSGTFVLFLFLSMSDSLVVVMQVIDAYRNFVAVGQYTVIDSESELTVDKIHRRDWSCKFFLFFWHFALQLSAWLVMALSVDRYASLKHIKFIRSRPFLYRRAWIIVGSIVAVLFLLNMPFLLFVRSTVIKTHCALNHFCIFGGWDSLWPKHSYSQSRLGPKQGAVESTEGAETKTLLQVMSIGEAVESPTARRISLWLSRQHLLVFGIIPYAVTFLFNMILIHYLCSCPPKKNAYLADLVNRSRVQACVPMNDNASASRKLCIWDCFTCFSQQRRIGKRKSTTSTALVLLNKDRAGRKWDATNPNKQMQSNLQHLMPVQKVRPIMFGLDPIARNCQAKNGRVLAIEFRPPATSTSIHETTDCSSNQYMAKCMHFPNDQNGTDEVMNPPRQTPALIDPNLGFQHQTQSATQVRLNEGSTIRKRAQTSSSGFWIGQKRTTILLLVVTFTFIGLTLPYHIYVELEHFHKVNKGASTHYDLVHAADDLCRFLLFMNNCMNFIIYMTGRQFRKGFFFVLHRIRRSLLRWLLCESPQTDSRWHRHPPHRRRRNRHRHLVRDHKQACRLILAANQVERRVSVHRNCIIHEPGCPLAKHKESAAFSAD